MNLDILCRSRSLTMVDLTECCMLTVHGSHTLIKISNSDCYTLTMHGSHMLIKIPTLNATH